jgi:hypothetical protein
MSAGKLGSRSPQTRCGTARLLFLFVAGCLSN